MLQNSEDVKKGVLYGFIMFLTSFDLLVVT